MQDGSSKVSTKSSTLRLGEAPRYLLLQIRNPGDPMRDHEVTAFARALRCRTLEIRTASLLDGRPPDEIIHAADVVLIGGSGDYSVAEGGSWMEPTLQVMRMLHDTSKPTFASCWGFQAFALALGGEVITDVNRAELGTVTLELTEAGQHDAVFRHLPKTFRAAAGHQDSVIRLPEDAIRLASSSSVENQAFRFASKPIYGTQFHPELDRTAFLQRVGAYPRYVESIVGKPFAEFASACVEIPESNQLIGRFVADLAIRT